MKSKMNPIRAILVSRPISVILWKIKCRLLNSRVPGVKEWIAFFNGKDGLEIGGPSGVFNSNNYLPVYSVARNIDGVNYRADNLWSSSPGDLRYHYENRSGKLYILDGVNLEAIGDGQYDFLLSCNNLEHIANPIKALVEWKRVLKNDGVLLLILPRKESNFDNKRPVTSLEHLKEDYRKQTGEDDLTHLEEILKLHDLKRDPLAGNRKDFEKRGIENKKFRALHHHVFDVPLLIGLMNEIGMKTMKTYSSPTDHFILALK